MQEIKDLSNTVLNQAKYISDNAKDNVINFQKELIRKNPMNSMQYTWQIAQMRKNFVFWSTLPFIISQTFWDTWQQVYRPDFKIESSPKEENY